MLQSKTARRPLAALLACVLAAPSLTADHGGGRAFQVRMAGRGGTAVRRALSAARLRLADEPCRRVLADFEVSGRSLDAILVDRGRTAAAHLDTLVFRDGTGRSRCARPDVMAYTHVGGDTIFVCTGSFGRVAERDPRFAEIVVIHEVLHTLGLGENPPTSGEITARVEERCGS